MEEIIEKYYLLPNSELVYYEERTLGVDCWFDTNTQRQHRCLSFEDFNSMKEKTVADCVISNHETNIGM